MKTFYAFFRKEFIELLRNGKLAILGIIFTVLGIMNAGIAKITPVLMESLADEMEQSGFTISKIEVNAVTVWQQFFSNYSIAIIVLIIMFAGCFAVEYSKGTLVPLITKGLPKSCVIASKLIMTEIIWTFGYWLCFGVTYLYAEIYWDNSIMQHLGFAVLMPYLFGIFLLAAMIFFASFSSGTAAVLLGTGAVYLIPTLIGIKSDWKKYLPTYLTSSLSLFTSETVPSDYLFSMAVTGVLTVLFIAGAFICGRKKVQ